MKTSAKQYPVSRLAMSYEEIAWLAAFGMVTQGGGLGLYTMGARRLPAAQAALLSASEVPMAPLWVWIFFYEVPARETFIGGGHRNESSAG